MIDVIRIPLPKDRLRAMSKEERALFFPAGLCRKSNNLVSETFDFFDQQNSLHRCRGKNLRGANADAGARLDWIFHEAWKLVSTRFLASPIGKELAPKLNPIGQRALAELKKHFGGSNLISKLRNNVAFHHPYESDMEAGFEAAVSDKNWDNEWNWYFSTATWNSFYFASDFVILHGILISIGEADLVEA